MSGQTPFRLTSPDAADEGALEDTALDPVDELAALDEAALDETSVGETALDTEDAALVSATVEDAGVELDDEEDVLELPQAASVIDATNAAATAALRLDNFLTRNSCSGLLGQGDSTSRTSAAGATTNIQGKEVSRLR